MAAPIWYDANPELANAFDHLRAAHRSQDAAARAIANIETHRNFISASNLSVVIEDLNRHAGVTVDEAEQAVIRAARGLPEPVPPRVGPFCGYGRGMGGEQFLGVPACREHAYYVVRATGQSEDCLSCKDHLVVPINRGIALNYGQGWATVLMLRPNGSDIRADLKGDQAHLWVP